jgi:hypothetical protein
MTKLYSKCRFANTAWTKDYHFILFHVDSETDAAAAAAEVKARSSLNVAAHTCLRNKGEVLVQKY